MGILLFILAFYHAWVRRIPVVASLVVPALIMFVYVAWVLYTASRDKHRVSILLYLYMLNVLLLKLTPYESILLYKALGMEILWKVKLILSLIHKSYVLLRKFPCNNHASKTIVQGVNFSNVSELTHKNIPTLTTPYKHLFC